MNQPMNSLSGSFRLSMHERVAIQVLRGSLKMSINHIGETMRRSTATIQGYLKIANMAGVVDNRGKTQIQHQNRRLTFNLRIGPIRAAFNLYKNGRASSFLEALSMTIRNFGRVPGQEEYKIAQLAAASGQGIQDSESGSSQEASESSPEGEEEEPA